MKKKKILLVSPNFHGYWKAMQASLESLGYLVTTHRYDAPSGFLARTHNKLVHELPVSLRKRLIKDNITRDTINALHGVKPDIVVVIKGDLLGQAWWDALDQNGAAKITWLYDEIRRMDYTWDLLAEIGPLVSYSPLDVARLEELNISSEVLPTAFDHRMSYEASPTSAVTFIGARYPGRLKTLQSLQGAGIPVLTYGKTWSRHPWDVLRTHQWAASGIPAMRDIPRGEAYGIMAGSPATLNMHENQDGFTARTFEACGVGTLQIIDRHDVSSIYDTDSEVQAFENEHELQELATRALKDPVWAAQIGSAAKKRTLAEHTFDHRFERLEKLWD